MSDGKVCGFCQLPYEGDFCACTQPYKEAAERVLKPEHHFRQLRREALRYLVPQPSDWLYAELGRLYEHSKRYSQLRHLAQEYLWAVEDGMVDGEAKDDLEKFLYGKLRSR
jgi:hypothetical protein